MLEEGIIACRRMLNKVNQSNCNNFWLSYIRNALIAKEFYILNVNYVINKKKVILIDEFTGRIEEGRKWSEGIHQAIEIKENFDIQNENQTLASISYQNLFLLYAQLSGMTGTARSEAIEFKNTYHINVINS